MDAKHFVNRDAIAKTLNKTLCSTCITLIADVLQWRVALSVDEGRHSEEIFKQLSRRDSWSMRKIEEDKDPTYTLLDDVWSYIPSSFPTDETGPPFAARFLHLNKPSLETSAAAGCEFCKLLSDFFIHRPWPNPPSRVAVHVANRPISSPWRGISPGCLNDLNMAHPLLISCSTSGFHNLETFLGCIVIRSGVEGQLFKKTFPSSPPTFSPGALSALMGKMVECRDVEDHTACQRGPRFLPSRALDISKNGTGIDKIALVEGNFEGTYAALSHCWGGTLDMKTTRKNVRSHMEGISIHDLPKCFREAALLCRELQIRYLWIDALCIVQDDAADWDQEASMMAAVYENAELVISAADSYSTQGGLSFQRTLQLTFDPGEESGPAPFPSLSSLWACSTLLEGTVSPLETRGWCFQERALATSIIHLYHHGLRWECKSYSSLLCTGLDMNRECLHPFLKCMVPQDDFGQPKYAWYIGVQYYTKRLLTFQEDRFPAIAGFATKCEEQGLVSGRYLAGLWEDEILLGLTWAMEKSRENDQTRILAMSDRAPSWSWASSGREAVWGMAYVTSFLLREIALVDHKNIYMSSWSKTAKSVQGRLPLTAPFFPLLETFWDEDKSSADLPLHWTETIEIQTRVAEVISPLQQLDLSEVDTTATIHHGPFFSESASPVLTWRDITLAMDYPQEFYLGRKTFLVELCNLEIPGTFRDEPATFPTFFLLVEAAISGGRILPNTYRRVGLVRAGRGLKNIGDPTLPLMKGADVVSIVLI